ncbi:hypothetical protein [Thiobacillus sp.]
MVENLLDAVRAALGRWLTAEEKGGNAGERLQLYEIRFMTETQLSLRASVSEYGFAYLEDALGDELKAALRAEAAVKSGNARSAIESSAIVGGSGLAPGHSRGNARSAIESSAIPYKARIADLGDDALSFLRSPSIVQLLNALFEEPLTLSEGASHYTFYGPGDFLSLHRDRPVECAATLILYLDATSPDSHSPLTGLSLRVFGEHGEKAAEPRLIIPTRIGTMVVGSGSRTWHERPPLQPDERVIALTACFAAAS